MNKPYLVYNDDILKKKKKHNNNWTFLIYLLFLVVAGTVFFVYKKDQEFLANNATIIEKNDKKETEQTNDQNIDNNSNDNIEVVQESQKISQSLKEEEKPTSSGTQRSREGQIPPAGGSQTIIEQPQPEIKSISLNEYVSLKKGSSLMLIPTIIPSDVNVGKLDWSSSNSNIVTVDSNGKIVAKNIGIAFITVKTKNGKVATSKIEVTKEPERIIDVENITLDKTNVQIEKNKSLQLITTITPSNATNKSVEWNSSNPKVATVENGRIQAISGGVAVITAKTNNGKTASCYVTVIVPAERIIIVNTEDTVKVDGIINLKAIIEPDDVTNNKVTWESSNSNIATVDQNGLLIGKSVGNVTITAKTSNGKVATKVIKVIAKEIPVTSISLNSSNLEIKIGESSTLTATITPSNATNKNITWNSSNTKVAIVENGKVTGKSVGNATITVKTSNGKTATCSVTVKNNEILPTKVTLNEENVTIKKGKSTTLTATIEPSNATNKNITWNSSNTKVATVENGKVTGKSVGTATITVKTSNGKTASCSVTVVGLTYKLTLDNQSATSSGTKEIWYQFNTTQIIDGEVCYYYTDSNLTTCLKEQKIVKPTKKGYKFGGYWTKKNGEGKKYIDANGLLVNDAYKNLEANTTLYAKWTPNSYKITFNENGGSSWTSSTCSNPYNLSDGICSQKVSYDSTYQSFPTPTRDGYTFDGWWTDASNGTKITSLTIKKDVTIYAHWKEKSTSINFVYYYQLDYKRVNFCGTSRTLAQAGCGVTSAAMVATSLKDDRTYNPVYMMNMAKAGHYCGPGITGTKVSFFKYFSKELGLNYEVMTKGDKNKVLNALRSGKSLVIAHMGPGTFTEQGHYIVLGKADNNKNVYVYDPADKSKNHYWNIDKIAKELRHYDSFHVISNN